MEEIYKEFYEWVDRIEKEDSGYQMFGRRVLVKLLEMRERIEQLRAADGWTEARPGLFSRPVDPEVQKRMPSSRRKRK